jgi:hypothetical protein
MTERSGGEAILSVLDRVGKVDAVVASSDWMAIGAIAALTGRGLLVPRDVAVVGFGDDASARAAVVPLTTVHQPVTEMGEAAVSGLIDWITTGQRPSDLRLPWELVIRQSCGCLPSVRPEPFDRALPSFAPFDLEHVQRRLAYAGAPDERALGDVLAALHEDIRQERVAQSERVLAALALDWGRSAEAIAAWRRVLETLRRALAPELGPAGREVLFDFASRGERLLADAAVRAERFAAHRRLVRLEAALELTLAIADAGDVEELVRCLDEGIAGLGIAGYGLADRAPAPSSFSIVVPLRGAGRRLGVLAFDAAPDQWSILSPVARHAATALARFSEGVGRDGQSWIPGENMMGYSTVTTPPSVLGKCSSLYCATMHRTTSSSGIGVGVQTSFASLTDPSRPITKCTLTSPMR